MAQATGAPPTTGHSAQRRLMESRSATSRYWRVAAHVMGVAPADLCPDEAWIASLEQAPVTTSSRGLLVGGADADMPDPPAPTTTHVHHLSDPPIADATTDAGDDLIDDTRALDCDPEDEAPAYRPGGLDASVAQASAIIDRIAAAPTARDARRALALGRAIFDVLRPRRSTDARDAAIAEALERSDRAATDAAEALRVARAVAAELVAARDDLRRAVDALDRLRRAMTPE